MESFSEHKHVVQNGDDPRNGQQYAISSPTIPSHDQPGEVQASADSNEIGTIIKVEAGANGQSILENIPDSTKHHGNALPAVTTKIRGGDGHAKEDRTSPAQEEMGSQSQLEPSSSFTEQPYEDSLSSSSESEIPRIQAYAKLEFDDGQFYMNTYQVELGRDVRVARNANSYSATTPPSIQERAHRASNSSGRASGSQRLTQEDAQKLAGGVVSESGGIIGVNVEEVAQNGIIPRQPTSTSSSSRIDSRKNSLHNGPSNGHASHSALNGAHHVSDLDLLPSPDQCPLIPIHPPAVAEGDLAGHRGISRKHVKIAYNFHKRLFELEIKGKNGAFLDDHHCRAGEVHELKSGSCIQIGGVRIHFVLPDVELGETGADGTTGSEPASGGAMSFEFEDGRGESIDMANSSQSSQDEVDESEQERRGRPRRRGGKYRHEEPKKGLREPKSNGARGRFTKQHEESESNDSGDDEESDNDSDDDDDEQEEEVHTAVKQSKGRKQAAQMKSNVKAKARAKVEPPPPPVKRKGPGRPPKNGIISKREQALLAKQAKEAAQADARVKPSKDAKGKISKTIEGRDQTGATADAKPEKRKYTKRKKLELPAEEQDDARQTTETTESLPPEQAQAPPPPRQPKRPPKPPKPPKSPSPVWDESKLTPEQLAKPSQSYVVLIHEALSNSPTGQMTLPQIYRAIMRRYPFYKLRVTTVGWQSSVRHNLSQHSAFRKIERDGKGWMWGLVPEVPIEKEKKQRRLTPPAPNPAPRQSYYPPAPYYPHSYAMHHPPPNGPPGPYPLPAHAPMHHMPPMHPLPNYHGPPRGLPLHPAHAPLDGTGTVYRSPYDPKPPLSVNPPPPGPVYVPTTPPLPQQPPQPQQGPPPPPPPPQHPEAIYSKPPALPPKPSPTPNPPLQTSNRNHDILTAVSRFKAVLVQSMSNEPNGEQIVSNAVNRVLRKMDIINGQDLPEPTQEFPSEKAIMDRLQSMLGKLEEKRTGSNTPGPPMRVQTPNDTPMWVQTPIAQGGEKKESLEAGVVAEAANAVGGNSAAAVERRDGNGVSQITLDARGQGNGADRTASPTNGVAIASSNGGGNPVEEEKKSLKRPLDDDDEHAPQQGESKRIASGSYPQVV